MWVDGSASSLETTGVGSDGRFLVFGTTGFDVFGIFVA
jgi:hypothetical protein